MSFYHSILLALGSLAALLCLRTDPGPNTKAQAILGLVTMAAAMIATDRRVLALIIAAMLLPVLSTIWNGLPAGPLAWHRSLSTAVMAFVVAALATINVGAICGDLALPLIGRYGINDYYLHWTAGLFVRFSVACLAGYCIFSFVLLLRYTVGRDRLQRLALAELGAMTTATIGMALGGF